MTFYNVQPNEWLWFNLVTQKFEIGSCAMAIRLRSLSQFTAADAADFAVADGM